MPPSTSDLLDAPSDKRFCQGGCLQGGINVAPPVLRLPPDVFHWFFNCRSVLGVELFRVRNE